MLLGICTRNIMMNTQLDRLLCCWSTVIDLNITPVKSCRAEIVGRSSTVTTVDDSALFRARFVTILFSHPLDLRSAHHIARKDGRSEGGGKERCSWCCGREE